MIRSKVHLYILIGSKRLADEYSEAINMLKEKWKSKPKANQFTKPNESSSHIKKNSTSNKEDVIRNMNKTAEAQIQQPTQGQQKSIRISDDVDLDMYTSTNKGITPMTNALAAIGSKESLKNSAYFKNKEMSSPKNANFRVSRYYKPGRKIKSTTRIGSIK